jgi:peroxiredoxin
MLPDGSLIPPLTLRTADGRTVRAWDFKQKKSLVIAFLDAECAPCEEFLRRIAAQAAELRARETVALFVFLELPSAGFADSLPPEIVAGSDIPGRAAREFLGEDSSSFQGAARRGVFVADRYGELFAQWILRGHEFPAFPEIVRWLDHAAIVCDGCC